MITTQSSLASRPLKQAPALPTMYDLPSENPEDPGLPDYFHYLQPHLLDVTLQSDIPSDQFFSTGDMNLYYDLAHPMWYKRPDWFLVLDVPRLYQQRDSRLSYVLWDEQLPPYIVVELISPGTEKEDLGQTRHQPNRPPTKWMVYEQLVKVPYYVIFNRYTDALTMYQLVGSRYRQIISPDNRLWLPRLELGLSLWQGTYRGLTRSWLRWYDRSGEWILTPEEETLQQIVRADEQTARADEQTTRADEQTARADEQTARADEQTARAELYAAKLRALGLDPDNL